MHNRSEKGDGMDEQDLEFFLQHEKGKMLFSKVVNQAKKKIVLFDSNDDFVEEISENIQEECGMPLDEAKKFSDALFRVWENLCGCSLTAFDREVGNIKKQLFI